MSATIHFTGQYPTFTITSFADFRLINLPELESSLGICFNFGAYRAISSRLDSLGSYYKRLKESSSLFQRPLYSIHASQENPFIHSFAKSSISYYTEQVDLAFGQSKADQVPSEFNNYFEFPLIFQNFVTSLSGNKGLPTLGELEVLCQEIEEARTLELASRSKYFALIASHDGLLNMRGVREKIYHLLNSMCSSQKVQCGGAFFHNDDSLQQDFANNKIDYLKQFIFNVCPENSYTPGYVTEKILDAYQAGCIPIYWGGIQCLNHIFNPKAYLYFNPRDFRAFANQLAEVFNHSERFQAFIKEPVFMPGAAARIFVDYFYPLYRRLLNEGDFKIDNFRLTKDRLGENYNLEEDRKRAQEILKSLGLDPQGKHDYLFASINQWPFLQKDIQSYRIFYSHLEKLRNFDKQRF